MKPHVVCWQTSLIRTDGALNAIDMPNLFSANRQQFPGFLPTLPFFVGCFYASWQKNFMADFETSPFALPAAKASVNFFMPARKACANASHFIRRARGGAFFGNDLF
jgi:hypothetical protein